MSHENSTAEQDRACELAEMESQAAEDFGIPESNRGRRSFLAAAVSAAAGVPFIAATASAGEGGLSVLRRRSPRGPQVPRRPRGPQRGQNPDFVSEEEVASRLRRIFSYVPTFFEDVQEHENEHVDFLVGALGSAARPKPTFQNLEQATFQQFVEVTQALENTGVGAYLGAAPVIFNRDFLAAAGSIATVEARHAGTVNFLLGDPVVPSGSFDEPLTPGQVQSRAGGFVQSLNGGPPLNYRTTPSASNDVFILNFALALEFLEAEFYNINVPKFFSQFT